MHTQLTVHTWSVGGGSKMTACPKTDPVFCHNKSIDRGSREYYPNCELGEQNGTNEGGIVQLTEKSSSMVGQILKFF